MTAYALSDHVHVDSLPNITGSVNVTNSVLRVTGSVGIDSITFPGSMTVTGSVAIVNFPVVQQVTGSVLLTNPAGSARSSPMVTAVVSTILAANPLRKGATFYHDGTGNCFIALGAAATITDFTVRMAANDYYEVPFGYTGIITAVRAAGSNVLRVTEVTL